MAIIQTLGWKQRWRILFSKLPRNLFELYCREQRKQNVKINPTILIKGATSCKASGGIDWCLSTLGVDFWAYIAWRSIHKTKKIEDVQCIIDATKKFVDFRNYD